MIQIKERDLIKNKKIFLPLEWAANYDNVNFKYQDETFPIFNNILNAKTELFAFLSRKSINSQKSFSKDKNINTSIDVDKRVLKLIDKNQKEDNIQDKTDEEREESEIQPKSEKSEEINNIKRNRIIKITM